MAILHRATITPTKLELAAAWLDRQGLGGGGHVELAGSYRFDDPPGRSASRDSWCGGQARCSIFRLPTAARRSTGPGRT